MLMRHARLNGNTNVLHYPSGRAYVVAMIIYHPGLSSNATNNGLTYIERLLWHDNSSFSCKKYAYDIEYVT